MTLGESSGAAKVGLGPAAGLVPISPLPSTGRNAHSVEVVAKSFGSRHVGDEGLGRRPCLTFVVFQTSHMAVSGQFRGHLRGEIDLSFVQVAENKRPTFLGRCLLDEALSVR